MWTKIDNFHHFDSGSLNQQVLYKHQSSNSQIKKIDIKGYTNNNFSITVKARNSLNFTLLSTKIEQTGFFESVERDRVFNQVSFSTDNKDALTLFIQTIERFQSDINEIEKELCEILGIDTSSNPTMPDWLQDGDFSIHSIRSSNSNRYKKYIATSNHSIIRELKILGYSCGDVSISMVLKKPQHLELREQLLTANFNLDLDLNEDIAIRLNRANRADRLQQFLTILSPYTNNLHEISDEIIANIANVLPIEVSSQPSNTPAFPLTSGLLPLARTKETANPMQKKLIHLYSYLLFNHYKTIEILSNTLLVSHLQACSNRPSVELYPESTPSSLGRNSEKLEEDLKFDEENINEMNTSPRF